MQALQEPLGDIGRIWMYALLLIIIDSFNTIIVIIIIYYLLIIFRIVYCTSTEQKE